LADSPRVRSAWRLDQRALDGVCFPGQPEGFVIGPAAELLDDIEAYDRVDHALAIGRPHAAELLDIALVADRGHIEDLKAEAEDLDDLGIDRPTPTAISSAPRKSMALEPLPDHPIGLALHAKASSAFSFR
jgi:hypothetical protein